MDTTILGILLFIWVATGFILGLLEAVDPDPLSERITPNKRVLYWCLFGITGFVTWVVIKSITGFFEWLQR